MTKNEKKTPVAKDDGVERFFDFCSLSQAKKKELTLGSTQQRDDSTIPVSTVKKEQVLRLEPMTWFEEAVCVLFLTLGVPNGVITIPLLTAVCGKIFLNNITRAFQILGLLLLPLVVLPQSFVPETLQSWLAHLIVKYFSFRFVYDERPPTQDQVNSPHAPQILVAPPHGVFPYGNILAMLIYPSMSGHHFLGLASSAALRPPVFKQILRSIGVIDADRNTARRALETFPHTIGISTGGVAEVFETNSEHECIVLKERIGLIKLAIRTGADLVPCYVFGNTKLLNCFIPGGDLLKPLSRKLGFALIWIYGRFGLPIPYRFPVFGVTGKPVPTHQLGGIEEPTMEQIREIQDKLLAGVQDVFEKYKGLYGWEDKDLIIK